MEASPLIIEKFTKLLNKITEPNKVEPGLDVVDGPCGRIFWEHFIQLVKVHSFVVN